MYNKIRVTIEEGKDGEYTRLTQIEGEGIIGAVKAEDGTTSMVVGALSQRDVVNTVCHIGRNIVSEAMPEINAKAFALSFSRALKDALSERSAESSDERLIELLEGLLGAMKEGAGRHR